MDDLHRFLASDPNVLRSFSRLFDSAEEAVLCDWCGCETHHPVHANGLSFAPDCYPLYQADCAEQAEIDNLPAAAASPQPCPDGDPEDSEAHFRNLRMRKQAAREEMAEQGFTEAIA